MTPKEKAIELVDKFYQYLPIERDVTTSEGELSWEYHGWGNAKQCALIAVDEILDTITNIHWRTYVSIYIQEKYMNIDEAIEYYKEVKQEIEKL